RTSSYRTIEGVPLQEPKDFMSFSLASPLIGTPTPGDAARRLTWPQRVGGVWVSPSAPGGFGPSWYPVLGAPGLAQVVGVQRSDETNHRPCRAQRLPRDAAGPRRPIVRIDVVSVVVPIAEHAAPDRALGERIQDGGENADLASGSGRRRRGRLRQEDGQAHL